MNIDNFMLLLASAPSSGAGNASGGSSIVSLITFGLLFLVMYTVLIRPQSRRKKQHRQQLEMLAVGDKIATIGGMHGTIARVEQAYVIVKVDENAKIKFSKEAIATVFPKSNSSQPQQEKSKSVPSNGTQKSDSKRRNVSEKKISNNAQKTSIASRAKKNTSN